jgi:hypothetical protein
VALREVLVADNPLISPYESQCSCHFSKRECGSCLHAWGKHLVATPSCPRPGHAGTGNRSLTVSCSATRGKRHEFVIRLTISNGRGGKEGKEGVMRVSVEWEWMCRPRT